MTPGLAGGLRDPSFVLRSRLLWRRICGLLPGPACPGSPGIRAAGAGLRAGLVSGLKPDCNRAFRPDDAGSYCDADVASRGDAVR